MLWLKYTLLLHIVIVIVIVHINSEIHDPLNIFCGSISCYDILNVSRDASIKDIKKAFRTLSLTQHPDKNKEQNATDNFRKISKAFEVLTGNESRVLFDYYLAHPRDYFKVSGQHYIQNLPHSDVRIVLTMVILLISWILHMLQNQRHQKAVQFLKLATLNNFTLKSGGTKQTMELHRRASELYEINLKERKTPGEKNIGKIKMIKDPMFEQFVNQVVSEVQFEGGYKKPELKDLFIVQIVLFPYTCFKWMMKYYRRHVSSQPLSAEELEEMVCEEVGYGVWDEASEAERKRLIGLKVWTSQGYEKYQTELNQSNTKSTKRNKRNSHQTFDEDDG